MAKNTQISVVVINAQATDLATRLNGATLSYYDGTQPATVETTVTTQTKGVDLTLSTVAFGSPVNGVITANTITSGVAVAAITPTWGRFTVNGIAVMDVSVGTITENITQAAFALGDTITLTSFTHSVLPTSSGL
jgi:hypothetical protein